MTNSREYIQCVYTLGKGMIHTPGGTEQDCESFHHTIHEGAQFKTYETFIYGISYLIFSNCV